MATLSFQVTSAGISAPDYPDILQQLKIAFWQIYGNDANLDDDTQDGQLLAVIAQGFHNVNQNAIALYNSFSPATAQGAALSTVVKINGIRRKIPSRSTATVRLVGAVGTQVFGGEIGDSLNLGTRWTIPDTTIPGAGQVDVTATCTADGDVAAAPNTLTVILTPTLGWQTVTNPASAVPGNPVESDADLRRRQAASPAIGALTIIEAIFAGIADLPGVSRLRIYVNDTNAPDANGVPAHSIAVVVQGGDIDSIAGVIATKKSPGTGTYGTTAVVVTDSHGIDNTINFYVVTQVVISVAISVQSLAGYNAATGLQIRQAVVDYLNGLEIGEDSYLARLYSPANLTGTGVGATFAVTSIEQSRDADPLAAADITLAFNEVTVCTLDDVELQVT